MVHCIFPLKNRLFPLIIHFYKNHNLVVFWKHHLDFQWNVWVATFLKFFGQWNTLSLYQYACLCFCFLKQLAMALDYHQGLPEQTVLAFSKSTSACRLQMCVQVYTSCACAQHTHTCLFLFLFLIVEGHI